MLDLKMKIKKNKNGQSGSYFFYSDLSDQDAYHMGIKALISNSRLTPGQPDHLPHVIFYSVSTHFKTAAVNKTIKMPEVKWQVITGVLRL